MPSKTPYGTWQAKAFRGRGYDRIRVHLGNYPTWEEAKKVEDEFKQKHSDQRVAQDQGPALPVAQWRV